MQLAPDGTMNDVESILARDLSPNEESPVTDTHRNRHKDSKPKRAKGGAGGAGGAGGGGGGTMKVNFKPMSKEERQKVSSRTLVDCIN